MISLDSYTDLRVAAKPLLRDHLFGLADIWADNTAADMALSAAEIRTRLTCDAENWDGLDGPPIANFWSPGLASQGEDLTTSKVLGRPFTMPLFVPTAEPALLTGLESHLYARQPMVAGFKAASHPTGTRYFIGVFHQQPPNRRRRGTMPITRLPVYCKSKWGYLVEPHTQTEADVFSPSGQPDVIWAVELTNITSGTSTITITPTGAIPASLDGLAVVKSAADLTITWSGSRPSRMLVCPSPPFRTYRGYASAAAFDDTHAFSRSGWLPNYLQPGQHYSVAATNATANIVWLENHPRPV